MEAGEGHGMSCELVFFRKAWENELKAFVLDESQMDYVFLPAKALDVLNDEFCFSVVILWEDVPVGFFVLHFSEEVSLFTDHEYAVFLRAFSINQKHQGKGYAKAALNQLQNFMQTHFPQISEVVLTVNENNVPAQRLYEESGFSYVGKNKQGRSGMELGMHILLKR
ncbi:GNAT family N-acetyltransferase [Paenibacillus gansuensis]|uniref:GNAT family N-acetyltransferase n=1 Tax=Paenibacillus gansuensis TaxID=306542 RepID=A0ABW5P9C0_9BACL